MMFGGITPFTLQDFPDHIAAILFTIGCNFRCGYCHNPEFVNGQMKPSDCLSEEDIFSFLERRRGLLQGVVICGGEPTLHRDLPMFMKRVKNMGFLVKLDTNGSHPEMIERILEKKIVDYIAMDLKYMPTQYERIVGSRKYNTLVKRSIGMVMTSGIPYEFRSTIFPQAHPLSVLQKMGKSIHGADKWVLQRFQNTVTLNDVFQKEPMYTEAEMMTLQRALTPYAKNVLIRC